MRLSEPELSRVNGTAVECMIWDHCDIDSVWDRESAQKVTLEKKKVAVFMAQIKAAAVASVFYDGFTTGFLNLGMAGPLVTVGDLRRSGNGLVTDSEEKVADTDAGRRDH